MDHEISRKSVQALGGIALRLSKVSVAIIKQLTMMISMENDYVTNEAIIVFKGNLF